MGLPFTCMHPKHKIIFLNITVGGVSKYKVIFLNTTVGCLNYVSKYNSGVSEYKIECLNQKNVGVKYKICASKYKDNDRHDVLSC